MNIVKEEYEDLFKSYDHLQLSDYSESIKAKSENETNINKKRVALIISLRNNYDGKTCPKCEHKDVPYGWCVMCGWRFEKIDEEVLIMDSQRAIDNSSIGSRTYGKRTCECGTEFTKKAPTQRHCTKECWRLHNPRHQ